VHLPVRALGLEPVLHPFPDAARTRAGGGHHVVVFTEATGDPVIEHHAVLGAHHPVAHPAHAQLHPLVDIEQAEQLGHVGAAQVELAQRGDVDEPDVLADIAHLGCRVAVVIGTQPLAGLDDGDVVGLVPRLDRRHPHRLEHPTGERAECERRVGGPPHGGADLADRLAPRLCNGGHRVDRLELALRRSHGGGGVALGQLHRVVPLVRGGHQVLGADVFGHVDHAVSVGAVELGMGIAAQRCSLVGCPSRLVAIDRQRPSGAGLQAMADRRGTGCGKATGGGAMLTQPVKISVAGEPARRQHIAGGVRREEPGCGGVIDGTVACHVEQRCRRRPAGCYHEQIGVDPLGAIGAVDHHGLDGPRRTAG